MSGGSGSLPDGLDEFQWQVHSYTNEYIRFADTKAAFVAVAATALIGALISSKIVDSCLKTMPCLWSFLQWSATFGLLLLACCVILSFVAIRPRLWNNTPIGFVFWGSITGHKTADSFVQSISKLSADERTTAISNHLYILARVAKRKYLYVDWAVLVGMAGGCVTALVLFLQHGLGRS